MNTMQLTLRINVDLIDELKLINPTLITRDPSSGSDKFRHGALGKYISRLIAADIEARKQQRAANRPKDILEEFLP